MMNGVSAEAVLSVRILLDIACTREAGLASGLEDNLEVLEAGHAFRPVKSDGMMKEAGR